MISVCMTTYNGQKFKKKQLDSILCQLSESDEIIISDDGSTDDTIKIINSYHDKRIKLINHIKNVSLGQENKFKNFYLVSSNFENALKFATGDYIFLADQDDIWKHNKVSLCVEYLKDNDIIMSNFSLIDENDNIYKEDYYDASPISKYLLINILRSHFLGCCMAFRKRVLDYALPFPKKLIGHDFWIGCLGVYRFKFSFIKESLHFYRRTNINVSTSTGVSKNSIFQRINYRICFLIKILIHIIRKMF